MSATRITARLLLWRRGAITILHVNGWTNDPEASRGKASIARQALRVASDDPACSRQGCLRARPLWRGHRCRHRIDRPCFGVNPSFARGWLRAAGSGCGPGNPNSRSSISRPRLRLSPHDRRSGKFMGIGVATLPAIRGRERRCCFCRCRSTRWATHLPVSLWPRLCGRTRGRGEGDHQAAPRPVTRLVMPSAMVHWRNPQNTASFSLSGLAAWPPARHHDRNPSPCRDPRRRCGGVVLATDRSQPRSYVTPPYAVLLGCRLTRCSPRIEGDLVKIDSDGLFGVSTPQRCCN